MPFLFLIRHGENEYVRTGKMPGRLPGIHLNPRGRAQALALAQALQNIPFRAVYASPLERAIETATPLAQSQGLEIFSRPALLDTDVGEWTGMDFKSLRELPEWQQVQRQPSRFTFPGGESFLQLQNRLVTEIEALAAAHQPKEALAIVFHADPVKLVAAHYLGLPLENFQRLTCDTGSVTALALNEHGARLLLMNAQPPFALDWKEDKKNEG